MANRMVTGFMLCALLILVSGTADVSAQAKVLVMSDFEKGTQKWEARGERVMISSSKDQAQSGTKSLKVTGRSANWQGTQLNISSLLKPKNTYRFTASFKLATNEKPDDVKLTLQRGDNVFDGIAAATITSEQWTTISGKIRYSGGDPYVLVYIESLRPNTPFYVDDFKLENLGDDVPEQSGVLLKNDFEDMTAQNWFARGEGVQMFSSNAGGSQSLKVSGRTAAGHGLAVDVSPLIFKGRTYEISALVRLVRGEPADSLKITMQQTPAKGETRFIEVTPLTPVTDREWVTLKGQFKAETSDSNLVISVESAGIKTSFYLDNFQISIPVAGATAATSKLSALEAPSLFQSLKEFFPVGVAVWKGDLSGKHAELVKRHFNSITSENDMKFESLQPAEGVFRFDAADAQVRFAKEHGMMIRGHTLVWHEQTPKWLFSDAEGKTLASNPENKELLLRRLEEHIRTVVGRYGKDVYAWDVVNEVVDPAEPDGMRKSEFYRISGLDYIRTAFRVTREVSPKAKLYINDYSTTDPKKRKFLYELVSKLLKEGVSIDGVGHQMHENIEFSTKESVIETIELFSGLKIDNQITELDISIYAGDHIAGYMNYNDIPRQAHIKQGQQYRAYFEAFRSLKGKISNVTFWSHSDDHTWKSKKNRVDAPLLFDMDLNVKAAFWGIVEPNRLPSSTN